MMILLELSGFDISYFVTTQRTFPQFFEGILNIGGGTGKAEIPTQPHLLQAPIVSDESIEMSMGSADKVIIYR